MKKQIILRKNEEHRILGGHLWVFSNEIKTLKGEPERGDIVELLRYDDKFLGTGFYNPHSLIAFRLLSRAHEEVNFSFFEQRIALALDLRRKLFPGSETFRVVHGESDFLPGLVIDKYNEFISIQTYSAGMDQRLTLLCDVLESIFHPKAIVERNDMQVRALEHLPLRKNVLRGTLGQTIMVENEIKYKIDILSGQKTGFFLDQRENRRAIQRYAKDANVLDCFCNEGGFSLNGIQGLAHKTLGLDSSDPAIANAKVNATLNNAANAQFEVADVFDRLTEFIQSGDRFDLIILDPPSFSRNKKTVATALKGYKELNTLALKLLSSGGILATASCSHHITEDSFLQAIEASARPLHRKLQLLELRGASPDHPALAMMPETSYLKFCIYSAI